MMDAAGLMWRSSVVSAHDVERQGANSSIRGASLVRRGRSSLPTPAALGSATRRVSVQAVDTSSRAKGAGRQLFAEPQWLFPSKNGDVLPGMSAGDNLEESSISGRPWSSSQTEPEKQSDALYYIVVSTAKDDKSGLSEPKGGILLSLIGENGKAILQKIPGTEESSYMNKRGEEATQMPSFLFQRGAVDVMTIVGPDLGRLAALWIAPEAGSWRLEKVSVTILPWPENLVIKDRLPSQNVPSLVVSDQLRESASSVAEWKAIFHLFESNEALLGDDVWLPAAELKPSLVQETSDIVNLQEKLLKLSPEIPRSVQGVSRLREESMKEYENLKLSLLGFSALLVVAGTASLAALGQGELAEGFSVGGVGGFFYLLLLQRAVDQLPGPLTPAFSEAKTDTGTQSVKDDNGSTRQSMGGKNGEVSNSLQQGRTVKNEERFSLQSTLPGNIQISGRVALVAGVALVLGRLAAGGAESTISAPELLAGVAGFFMSKVAVVLAALKPTSLPGDN